MNAPSPWLSPGDILPAAITPPALAPGLPNKPLYANPTAVANVDTGEDTLMSYTLPGGTLANIGDSIAVELLVTTGAGVNNKIIKVYFGAALTAFTIAGGSAATLFALLRIMRLDATHQQVSILQGGAPSQSALYVAAAQTLSGAVVVKVTGQSADGAGSITQQMMNIQLSQP